MGHIYGIDSSGEEFVKRAKEIADHVAAPVAASVDAEARFPAEAVSALREQRLTGLAIAKDSGGSGQGPQVFAGVAEELARQCGSTAMVYVMHVSASQTFLASKTLERRDALLRQTGAGEHLSTLAFSERGSRSQFWAPVSQLSPDSANGYTTSAQKSWVTSADFADSYVCTAQMPDAESPLESTLYLVDRAAPGITSPAAFDGLGLRGNNSAPVEFSDLQVDQGQLLTEHGAGATMMLEVVLPWFCVGTAAMAHGLCLAAIDATVQHLNSGSLEHTRNKLRDLPNLRARLAQMNVRTEQSRGLLGYTLSKLIEPDELTPLYVLQARMSALEAAVEVTDLAMRTCGGAAFSKHLGVERIFRDARAGWVMAPTVDHLQDFIGRSLVGLPLF